MPAPAGDRLLVGLGNPHRGDDAAGPLVVAEAARRLTGEAATLRVVERDEPVALLHHFDGVDVAVVVDAVRTGGDPGTVTMWETGAQASPVPAPAQAWAGPQSTHALGLAAVIDLARIMGRLPRRLVLVGIEAGGFRLGDALSASVRACIPAAAQAVAELLRSDAHRPPRG